jgi:DNA primase
VQLVEGVSFKEACERLAGPFTCSERPSRILPAQPATLEEERAPMWHTERFQKSAERTLKATQRRLLSREGAAGQHYLLGRGLLPETWCTYHLGFGTTFHPWQQRQMPAIFIPWFTADGGAISAIQHRFVEPTLAKAERYALKPGSEPLVFGLQALTPGDRLVVVEGEFNGMTLHQVGLPALSIGSESNRRHPETLCLLQDQLAPYKQIAVWLDQPGAGQQLVELLQPCPKAITLVDSQGQDANDLLCSGELYTFLRTLSLL